MAVDGLDALGLMIKARLAGAGVWEDRVYQDAAPEYATYPYLVFFSASGAEIKDTWGDNVEEHIISIKTVADDIIDANLAPAQVSDLFRKQGTQQTTNNPLNGGDDWEVVTCFKDRVISIMDPYADTKFVWHRGHQYQFRMEAK